MMDNTFERVALQRLTDFWQTPADLHTAPSALQALVRKGYAEVAAHGISSVSYRLKQCKHQGFCPSCKQQVEPGVVHGGT